MRAAVVLWGGWLLVYGAAFSAAQLWQNYYLATLVPAIAALSGIGFAGLWRIAAPGGRRAFVLVCALDVEAVWSVFLLGDNGSWAREVVVIAAALSTVAMFPLVMGSGVVQGEGNERSVRRRGRALDSVAVVIALGATLVGPGVAAGWLVTWHATPFDTPFSPNGTGAKHSAAALEVKNGYAAYSASVVPNTTPEIWDLISGLGRRVGDGPAGQGRNLLVYESSAASPFIMGGATDILPIGGYSGGIPEPSADQIRQLILSGKIAEAYVPGPGYLLSSDPRVVVIEALCDLLPGESSRVSAAPVIYNCDGGDSTGLGD